MGKIKKWCWLDCFKLYSEVVNMEDEEKQEEINKDDSNVSSVIEEAKNLITLQQKEIEELKAEIASFKEDKKEEEKTDNFSEMLDNFKSEMKSMLQAYNRQNTEQTKEESIPTIDDINFGFLNRRN